MISLTKMTSYLYSQSAKKTTELILLVITVPHIIIASDILSGIKETKSTFGASLWFLEMCINTGITF